MNEEANLVHWPHDIDLTEDDSGRWVGDALCYILFFFSFFFLLFFSLATYDVEVHFPDI